jgi:predicted nucleic acid-binding protein
MVIVYARQPASPFHDWAVEQIAQAVAEDGAGLNAVSLAELCSEDGVDPYEVAKSVAAFGVQLLDVPGAAAQRCGEAYRLFLRNRTAQSGKDSPKTPLPDFFIGAHAELLGVELVTNDAERFKTHFPKVKLVLP